MRTSTEEDTSNVLKASLKWAERRLPVGFDGGDGGGGDGGASEGDQSGAGASDAGASGDGGSGGTQGASDSDADASAFEARIERLEGTIRTLQSERDRAREEARKAGASSESSGSVDPDTLVSQIEERFAKRESLRVAADKLGKKYGRADKGILSRALDYDSPEALEAALKESHDAISSVIETELASERSKLLKDIEERYGVRVAPAGDAGKGNDAPKITIEQIEAMSLDEMADFELKNPGLIKSVLTLRSTT